MKIVICGLSISSSWGNGHATIYRALVRECLRRGHECLFLERDVEWYARHRDPLGDLYESTRLYQSVDELEQRWSRAASEADLVIVGSFTPDGCEVGRWVLETARGVCAFYDIDTPVTMSKLEDGDEQYVSAELIPAYDVYLSFTGGPLLDEIEQRWGARRAEAFYCTADPHRYLPAQAAVTYDLGYLGTYSPDRQPFLEELLVAPARKWQAGRFIVAGPQFPNTADWPANVRYIDHVGPDDHCDFFRKQRFTLNVTRAEMKRRGYSPSVRLFEAASCGVPIISDWWKGLDEFFEPDREICIAASSDDTLRILHDTSESHRKAMGVRLRDRLLRDHSPARRVDQLERLGHVLEQRHVGRA